MTQAYGINTAHMATLLVNSIYHAIEGEGVRIGGAQIFVRLQGCTVGCVNCDSMETWEFKGEPVETDKIIEQIEKLSANRPYWVSLTGGDPLHPKHETGLIELSKKLKDKNYKLNIEASGTRIPEELFNMMDYISCDFKTPSTGVRTPQRVLEKLVENYGDRYQIKSVISDKKDFDAALEMYQKLNEKFEEINWILTPCFETGEQAPIKRIKEIYEWVEKYPFFRVIAQQHKFVFGSKRLDV